MDKGNSLARRLRFEGLEPRLVLSLTFGAEYSEHHREGHGGGPGGPGDSGADKIDLPTVAAHEFGHSLGLPHNNVGCGAIDQPLMCPFYIGEAFELQPGDIDAIQALYPADGFVPSDGTWADGDTTNTLGTIDVTYSFVPDGTRMDQGRSTLFKAMDNVFGEDNWQPLFAEALGLWAAVTPLAFSEVSDDGRPTGAAGLGQSEPGIGDIRVGAHGFPKGTLAHTATLSNFPPDDTTRGDAHFNKGESWGNSPSSSTFIRGTISGIPKTSRTNLAAMSRAFGEIESDIILLAASVIRHSSSSDASSGSGSTQPDYFRDELLPATNVDFSP